MEIIKPGTHIDFVGKRKIAYSISGALILLSIISLIVHGGPEIRDRLRRRIADPGQVFPADPHRQDQGRPAGRQH